MVAGVVVVVVFVVVVDAGVDEDSGLGGKISISSLMSKSS